MSRRFASLAQIDYVKSDKSAAAHDAEGCGMSRLHKRPFPLIWMRSAPQGSFHMRRVCKASSQWGKFGDNGAWTSTPASAANSLKIQK